LKSIFCKRCRLEFFMAAVAENRMGAVLATAEVGSFGFSGFELNWRESSALVAAVAERLASAQAAGAPIVALACFDLDGIGTLLGNGWFGHGEHSLKVGRDIIADCEEPLPVSR
jgi:hypothetical protein